MQKSIFTLVFIFLYNTYLVAQPAIEWAKCFGSTCSDKINTMQPTSDGGYIMAGQSSTCTNGDVTVNNGSRDFWIVKVNSSGNLQWQKSFGGTYVEEAYSIQQTQDGGYIVCGIKHSNDGDIIDPVGYHSIGDYWILKLSNSGSIEWQKVLGGTFGDIPYSVQQTSDGGYIVTGRTDSQNGDISGNNGNRDCWIIKLDASGNIEWKKCYGGSQSEIAYSIIQTNDLGYLFVGQTNSNDGDVNGWHGNKDIWIVKLDNSGNISWQKCYGGIEDEEAYSVIKSPNGGYIITGYTESNDGNITLNHGGLGDVWVIKIDNSGNLQWQKCYGGSEGEVGNTIQATQDNGYIISGSTRSNDGDININHESVSDAWLIKIDNIGTVQWEGCYGGTDGEFNTTVIQDQQGRYIFAANTNSNDDNVNGNHGDYDFWLVKLSDITLINSQIATCGTCNGMATAVPTTGTPPYIYEWSGGQNTSSVTDLCSGLNTVTITDALGGVSEGYFTVINSDLILSLAQTGASCSSCPNDTITLIPSGGIGPYTYSWQGLADTTNIITEISPYNLIIGCVTDLTGCVVCDTIYTSVVGINEIEKSVEGLRIIPNPVTQTSTITWQQIRNQKTSIKLIDITGKELIILAEDMFLKGSNSVSLFRNQISVIDGLYFIKIESGEYIETKKILLKK